METLHFFKSIPLSTYWDSIINKLVEPKSVIFDPSTVKIYLNLLKPQWMAKSSIFVKYNTLDTGWNHEWCFAII